MNPVGGLLRALASEAYCSWCPNLCEMIDNCLDAKSTRIEIEWGKAAEYFQIEDNGEGSRDMKPFFQLGKHVEYESTRNGVFGVGGSLAQNWICASTGISTVRTVHEGVFRKASCNWADILQSTGDWLFDDEPPRPAKPSERGTAIVVAPCAHRPPGAGERFLKLQSDLGFIYSRSISQLNTKIRIRRSPKDEWSIVVAWAQPKLEPGFIETTVKFGAHWSAKIRVGIRARGTEEARDGLTYRVGSRSLMTTARGCGDYSVQGISGVVDLVGPAKDWPVTTHKDGLLDTPMTAELYAAVFDAIHPILIQAKQKSAQSDVTSLTEDLNALLNEQMGKAKARRQRSTEKPNEPSAEPTGTGGPHTKAEDEQDGETFPRRGTASKYLVDWLSFGKDDPRPSRFDPPKTVVLNKSHPWIAARRDEGNRHALMCTVTSTIGAEDLRLQQQGEEMFSGVMARAGNILRRIALAEAEAGSDASQKKTA